MWIRLNQRTIRFDFDSYHWDTPNQDLDEWMLFCQKTHNIDGRPIETVHRYGPFCQEEMLAVEQMLEKHIRLVDIDMELIGVRRELAQQQERNKKKKAGVCTLPTLRLTRKVDDPLIN